MSKEDKVISIPSPSLDPLEKLYVRVYLSTLSHTRAHEAVSPGIKKPKENNPFSRRENIQYHISLGLQEKAEAIELTAEKILEKLLKEATREGNGANHSARVQALTQLGKHFNLFEDKKEDKSHVFNIINYSTHKEEIEKEEKEEQVEESKCEEDLSDLIDFKDYNEENK